MAEIDDNAHLKSGSGTHIFRLKGLQTKVFLNQNPNYAEYDTPPVSASYFMDISINSLLLDDLIFISAASNYIDNSKWPDISFSLGRINNSSKTDIDTYFVDHITKKIGPAWLAKNITGGYNNSDIFHNEDELVEQYVTMDKSTSNLYYLQISPTDLNRNFNLYNISILDNTTNTLVTLYSPDVSGADFVTPGWVAGFDPSYALTDSDSEYLAYNTLDQLGVFIKYGFHTQIGHEYIINIKAETSDLTTKNLTVSIIDSNNIKPLYLHYDDEYENNSSLDSSRNFYIPNDILNTVYYSEPYTELNNLYDNSHENINYTENIIAGQTQAATGWIDSQFQNSYPPKNLPTNFAVGNEDNTFIITNVTLKKNAYIGYQQQAMLFQIGNNSTFDGGAFKTFTLYVSDADQIDSGLGTPNPNTQFLSITQNKGASSPKKRTTLDISDNTAPSTIIISIPKNGNLPIMLYQIKNGSIISYDAGARDDYFDDTFISSNNWFETIHIGGYYWGNSSSTRKWKGSINTVYRYKTYIPKLTDASTNIIFYDNSIKSQLIKVLKRGGTSEANPVSGMNLAQYYGSKYNIGREIMLSMFASDNELTINRINDILTYQPPPIVYDVSLNTGYKGDNIGNLVFYLNGVETPILHLTRGLNYEFDISGVDMSSNKFVFTKQLKTDGADISLNPPDENKVITSGLTYELDNSVKSFNDFYAEYESATTRKIKWSIPFNEVNVPSNSFYSSDISDNLGGNIVINKNPIYGAMRFIDGDLIQFHLDYSQKAIVDPSGVALDSSGNKLGSNPIEEQDYIVRLHIHDLFHYPKLKIPTPHPTILNIVNNLEPKDLSVSSIIGYVPGNDEANATSLLGYASGTSFTISVKFTVLTSTMTGGYDMIFGKYASSPYNGNNDFYFIGFNGWLKFHWNFSGAGQNGTKLISEFASDNDLSFEIEKDDSVILTMTHDYETQTSSFYLNDIETPIITLTLSNSNYYNDFYIKNGVFDNDSSSSLESAFITHNILDISDISHIHDSVQTAISNGHIENTLLELPTQNLNTQISYPIYNLNTQIKYEFKFLSTETNRNWRNWLTLDGSGIYLNNEASGNILGLQFATDSDEFGIGICSDICDNIWEEKPWEINKVPTDVSMISNNKFIWAFDASLNGNDYTYKIADTNGIIQDYHDTKLHDKKYNWKIEIKSDGKLCLKTSTDSALNVDSSYSDIQLVSDTRYYLWIGSKDPSFNFTNLKYLPETKVYDDEVTLGPLVQTYNQGSVTSYNTYNVVDQTEVVYNLSTADFTYLVTQGSNKIFIDGNRYSVDSPLLLILGNTYRFNLVNSTNLDTRLVFSELSNGTGELSDGITYNGTPGSYDTNQGSRDRSPYVDINTNDLSSSTLYYYDANGVNADITGTIIIKTPIEVIVTVESTDSGNIFKLNGVIDYTLTVGEVYRFNQSDPTNSGHPFRISTSLDGADYTINVSYVGIPGQPGSYTQLIVPSHYNSGDLYYKCQIHIGMGAAFT